jgi:TonB family protein
MQIRMHPTPLRTLSAAALQHLKDRQPSEIGGVLLGRVPPHSGEDAALILDAELIPAQVALYNSTQGDARNLESAVRRRRSESGLQVIGYFRSHVRDGLCLSPQDQDLIQSHLRDPEYIFLLIRPFDMGICVAAFFFWRNGTLQTDGSDLEVPFVALDGAHAASEEINRRPGFPAQMNAPRASLSERQPEQIPKKRAKAPQTKAKTRFFLVSFAATLAVAGAAGAGAYLAIPIWKSHLLAMTEPAPGTQIGLRVARAADGQLDLTWNREALERAKAQSALLTIVDGPVSKELTIDSAQLRTGTLTYFPSGADIQFRLETNLEGGRSVAESVRVVLPDLKKAEARVVPPVQPALEPRTEPVTLPRATSPSAESSHRPQPTHLRFKAPAFIPPSQVVMPERGVAGRLRAPDLRFDNSIAAYAASVSSLSVLFSPPPRSPVMLHFPTALNVTPNVVPPARQALVKPLPAPPSTERAAASYVPPHPVKQIMPDTSLIGPALASQTGQIEVQVTVDESGRVKKAQSLRNGKKARGLAAAAAVVAARQWVFEPATLHGKPIQAEHRIVFDFRSETQQ